MSGSSRPSRRSVLTTALAVAVAGHASGPRGWAAPSRPGDLTPLERRERGRLLSVISKTRPISPPDYAPTDLVPWRGGPFELRAEVVGQLEALFEAAEDHGIGLRVVSGYRSFDTQAGTYEWWVRHHGQASADARSARPGHSEHQTGLAVDLDDLVGGCYLKACFGQTDAGQWLARQGHRFGFVVSFPPGTQDRTGFAYEPWHLRYVGPAAAGAMHTLGIRLLEDYVRAHGRGAAIAVHLGG